MGGRFVRRQSGTTSESGATTPRGGASHGSGAARNAKRRCGARHLAGNARTPCPKTRQGDSPPVGVPRGTPTWWSHAQSTRAMRASTPFSALPSSARMWRAQPKKPHNEGRTAAPRSTETKSGSLTRSGAYIPLTGGACARANARGAKRPFSGTKRAGPVWREAFWYGLTPKHRPLHFASARPPRCSPHDQCAH